MKEREPGILLIRLMAGLLVAALLVLPHQAVRAGGGGIVRYVKPGGLKSGSCLTWGTACELRYALGSVAGLGDNIWAAKGTYKPAAGTNRALSFTLKSGVQIYGGFAGTETSFSQRNLNSNVSILSGDIGAAGNASDNSYHVVYASAVDSTAVLDGFQIVGGRASNSAYISDLSGGGMMNSGSPTLRHLRFIGNFATNSGGGMANMAGAQPSLTDVSFEGNATGSYDGGGMYNNASSPSLTNVTFSGNSAGRWGSGMMNENGSSPTLTNVTFSGNSGGTYGVGGGMYNVDTGTNPTLTNVTFSGNVAGIAGGAMYNASGAAPSLYNSILWGDSSTELLNSVDASAFINDSIVQGGCTNNSTCNGVSTANPVLKPLQNNGGFTKTRALGAGSAAIDTGNGATCAARDQRGILRPQGLGCDMGAFEVRAKSFVSQAANDGWILESGEFTGAGGTVKAGATSLILGDNTADKQYRSFVSFNTAGLPDGATIVMGKLKLTEQSSTGSDPFSTHGKLVMDLVKPYFDGALALQPGDFQALPTVSPAGTVKEPLFGTLFLGTLNSAARAAVNKTGTTQIRLRFTLDDNDNGSPDNIAFYSGDVTTSSYRPGLVIYYNP